MEETRFESPFPAPFILSGHQPVYLPSLHLFDKIAKSDAFMFVGHCQFRKGSWHNHNLIRGATLIVPTHAEFRAAINETTMGSGSFWRRQHLKAIEQAYAKRPYFDFYYPALASWIRTSGPSLAELNQNLIVLIMEWLNIRTKVYYSEDFRITGRKTDMLLNMCKAVGATEYLSSAGETYVDREKMAQRGIKHRFQDFVHPIYDQGAEFIPDLSAIDLLFNCGPNAAEYLRK